MTTVKFDPELTEMIFFDLEFYIPEADRRKPGASLKANPYKAGHFLLGGVFHRHFPLRQKNEDSGFQHYWVWRNGNEMAVLRFIFNFFMNSWSKIDNKDPMQADLIAVGIGISRFDIPILLIRSYVHKIDSPQKLFECYFKLKPIDLSNVGIGFLDGIKEVFYPKTTNQLMEMFRILQEKPSGIAASEMYDRGDYKGIEHRTENEVKNALRVYREMQRELCGKAKSSTAEYARTR